MNSWLARAMSACSRCPSTIPDPAKRWPNGSVGTLCQECWEAESARMWWAAVTLLDLMDALGANGTAAWGQS